ncbi:MAG: hypothetical protein JWP49_1418 [Phenylobacterium sp.]|jgi:hypothetical protein|nr:hypothetical protein [Phenylobacterium sp.]
MARDFGGAGPPKWRRGQRLAVARIRGGQLFLLLALLLIASLPLAMPASLEQTVILGHGKPAPTRPCQPITEAAFNRGWTNDPLIFTFSGVTFARRRADADCSSGKHGLFGVMGAIYPTCRFDAPYQLAVIDHGRTSYFAVPPGDTAVVEAAPQETRCKVTGRYDIYALTG